MKIRERHISGFLDPWPSIKLNSGLSGSTRLTGIIGSTGQIVVAYVRQVSN